MLQLKISLILARRYANYSDSPIVLSKLEKRGLNANITIGINTDNRHPQQYILRKGGRGTPGTIFHVDFDMAYVCKNLYKEHICQVDNILKVNCKVISDLTGIPSLDCPFLFTIPAILAVLIWQRQRRLLLSLWMPLATATA